MRYGWTDAVVMALSAGRFRQAATACRAAEDRRVSEVQTLERSAWERVMFGTWRIEAVAAALAGSKADQPTFDAYRRNMGFRDD